MWKKRLKLYTVGIEPINLKFTTIGCNFMTRLLKNPLVEKSSLTNGIRTIKSAKEAIFESEIDEIIRSVHEKPEILENIALDRREVNITLTLDPTSLEDVDTPEEEDNERCNRKLNLLAELTNHLIKTKRAAIFDKFATIRKLIGDGK